MQEVTCFHCRSAVQIAPGDELCSNCGEDLRGLLDAQHVSDYFCDRVAALSATGNNAEALAEAQRGLTYHDIAELHLLAAMLAKELERYDLMRSHVAAIPLDDSLRSEAEWLLRAHQDRQRALREGAKHGRKRSQSIGSSSILAEVLGLDQETTQPQRKRTQLWTGAGAAMIVVLLLLTIFTRGQHTVGIADESDAMDQAASGESVPETEPLSPQQTVSDPVQNEAQPAPAQDIEIPPPTPRPRLLPTPTPSVPEDLVLPASEGEAIVDSNPRSVVVLSADGFDLARVLRSSGYPELAELPIDARLQDGKLVLNGIVHLDLQRRQILEALESVPGIADVSAANLLLRPKQTYVVQPGDTMWTIVVDIYGDVDRLEDFYQANIDVAPTQDALRVGDELRVPPLE